MNNEDFNFESGIESYEDLQIKSRSDRYQFNLPYYNYDKLISQNYFEGNINFGSSGNNYLSDTNKLETNITNDITYNSLDYITDFGLKNNFSFSFKNLNSIGKKTSKYKSNPSERDLPASKVSDNPSLLSAKILSTFILFSDEE